MHARLHKKYRRPVLRKEHWPIVQFSKEYEAFTRKTAEEVYENILKGYPKVASLRQLLEDTIYKQKTRIYRYNWKVDKRKREGAFWKSCETRLFLPIKDQADEQARCKELLQCITTHYVQEITNKFRPVHYHVVTQVLLSGFRRLLSAAQVSIWKLLTGKRLHLLDKVNVLGPIDHVRKLTKKGVLVITPTHFSHTDPVFIGIIAKYVGLPPIMFGADINLYNTRFISYLLLKVGTYKIDRRKKDLMYLESLRVFKTGLIKYGCHSVFFPGGGRSRSGELGDPLKLGLLSTTATAQRELYQEHQGKNPPKVFIIPLVINYHFVLEAPSLIQDYLKNSGKARYHGEQDTYSTSYKILKFLFTLFTKGSTISISIGQGLDVLGNYVNDNGESLDKNGQVVDIEDYFKLHGKIKADPQREHEYTRNLSKRIVEEYHLNNQILSSHLIAFAVFEIIAKAHPNLDIYTLLRVPTKDLYVTYEVLEGVIKKLQKRIKELGEQRKLQYEPIIMQSPEVIIQAGIENCGMYHTLRPLLQDKKTKCITTQDMQLLYYYHNRLLGYEFEDLF